MHWFVTGCEEKLDIFEKPGIARMILNVLILKGYLILLHDLKQGNYIFIRYVNFIGLYILLYYIYLLNSCIFLQIVCDYFQFNRQLNFWPY